MGTTSEVLSPCQPKQNPPRHSEKRCSPLFEVPYVFRDPSVPPNLWALFCPNLSRRYPQAVMHPAKCRFITDCPEEVPLPGVAGSGPAWGSWGYWAVRRGISGYLGWAWSLASHPQIHAVSCGHFWFSQIPWAWAWLYSHFTEGHAEAQSSPASQGPRAVRVGPTLSLPTTSARKGSLLAFK